ncbi:helix-turn-helix domain-containing protein [Enterococcus casseliflavus]|uniref:helix-turn-helix domain-containing protein n=1 Tax=Enterococcus casseliflavus TaxID=37734 RepID=UPI0035C9D073
MDKTVGMKLKEARVERGLTLQQVADEVGCSPSYIHRIERNDRKSFNYKIYQQLLHVLEIKDTGSNYAEEIISELEQLLLSSKETKLKLQFALDAANQSINIIVEDLNTIEKGIENRLLEIIR